MAAGHGSSEAPPPIPPHPTSIAGRVTARLPSSFTLPTDSFTKKNLAREFSLYPADLISRYRTFVRANASQVSSIESALRSVTYILPGRFNETPLTSEAVYTSLTLLTAFHTNLLSPSPDASSAQHLPPQARYEKWCRAAGGSIYSRASALLRTIQYTQLLCEMFAKRSGEKIRWRVVVFLELVKAMCRLLMLRVTGNRPIIASSIGAESQDRISNPEEIEPDRPKMTEFTPVTQSENHEGANGHILTPDSGYASDTTTATSTSYKMPRTGLLLPSELPTANTTSPSPLSISDYLSSRALTPDSLKRPTSLVPPLLTTKASLAELLSILRPLLYALALQQFATTPTPPGVTRNNWKHAWTPWLLGIGMEVLSRQLAAQDVAERRAGGWKSLSVVEREEASRRSWGLGWWALRGGFYANVTKGVVEGVAEKLKGKPLLGMVGDMVEDYGWLWDEYYFATATV